jgi:hypothetical protein
MENKTFNDYSTQNYDDINWLGLKASQTKLTISLEQLDAQVRQQMQLQY